MGWKELDILTFIGALLRGVWTEFIISEESEQQIVLVVLPQEEGTPENKDTYVIP